MKNIKALLKLDFHLIKPYWMWLILFFGIALLTSIIGGGGIAFVLSWAIFAATILAFPFENVEKSSMEMLYATLPTNRKSMIFARYLFAVIFLVITIAVGLGVGSLIDVIQYQFPSYVNIGTEYYPNYVNQRIFANPFYTQMLFTMTALAFAVYSITFGMQTPFFYKFGYKKGRIFMWIPIILVMLVSLLPQLVNWASGGEIEFNIFNFLIGVPTVGEDGVVNYGHTARLITSLVSVGVGILSIVGSFFLSRKMYLKKNI